MRFARGVLLVAPVIVVLVAAVLAVDLRRAARDLDVLVGDDARDVFVVQQLLVDSERAARKTRAYLLTGEESYLLERDVIRAKIRADLVAAHGVIDTPEGRRLLAIIEARQHEAWVAADQAAEARRRDDVAGATRRLLEDIQPARDALDLAFASLVTHKKARLERHHAQVARQNHAAFRVSVGALGLASALWAAAAALARRDAQRNRRALAERRRVMELEERLVGIVSHDVRSPLAAIATSAELLLRGGRLSDVDDRAARRILVGTERIERLVATMLDFTRARTTGGIPLALAPGDVHAACRRAAEAYEGRAAIALDLQGRGEGEYDLERVEQALQNLVENALRYGAAGGTITIRARDEYDLVALSVHNDGAPIDEQLQTHLFEPFHRGPQRDAYVRVSFGLGLFIVREIARAHGGSVALRSTAADGTTFTLRLPRQRRTLP